MTTNRAIFSDSAADGESRGARLHRFTLDEYHRMIARGVFRENDPIELLESRLCIKLENGPPYDVPLGIPPGSIANTRIDPHPQRRFTVQEYHKLMSSGAFHPELRTELVEGWVVDRTTGTPRHDATLQIDGQVESYEDPSGPTDQPEYRSRAMHKRGESIPIILRNEKMRSVLVDELLGF